MTRLLFSFALAVVFAAACTATGGSTGAAPGPTSGAACSATATATCGYAGASAAVLVCTSGFWSAKAVCSAGAMCLVGAAGPECAVTAGADALANPDSSDAGVDAAVSPEVTDATGNDAADNDGSAAEVDVASGAKPCQKPSDCNDKDPCTADECNAATSTCSHVALVLCGKPLAACSATKDCGTGTVCDTASHACVGCMGNADCGVGNRCLQGQCAPSVACQSDMQCKVAGGICDVATGVCVQCLKDSHCGSGQQCKGQSCVTKQACVSSKDCQGVCNEGLGLCVGCNSDLDCDTGNYCAANAECKPVVCTQASGACAGGQLWGCSANGSGYTQKDSCDDGNPCTVDGCSTGACTHLVAPSGSPCGAGGTCNVAGSCDVKVCDPQNPNYCKGNTAMKCDATGLQPTVVQTCAATQTCAKGACEVTGCSPATSTADQWFACPPQVVNPGGKLHGKACSADSECMYGHCMFGLPLAAYDKSVGICSKNCGFQGSNANTSCSVEQGNPAASDMYYCTAERAATVGNTMRDMSKPALFKMCAHGCKGDDDCKAWNPALPTCAKSSTQALSTNPNGVCIKLP